MLTFLIAARCTFFNGKIISIKYGATSELKKKVFVVHIGSSILCMISRIKHLATLEFHIWWNEIIEIVAVKRDPSGSDQWQMNFADYNYSAAVFWKITKLVFECACVWALIECIDTLKISSYTK